MLILKGKIGKGFLRGMGSVLDIFPARKLRPRLSVRRGVSDLATLHRDAMKVVRDFRVVVEKNLPEPAHGR